jgi:hypothetical protein
MEAKYAEEVRRRGWGPLGPAGGCWGPLGAAGVRWGLLGACCGAVTLGPGGWYSTSSTRGWRPSSSSRTRSAGTRWATDAPRPRDTLNILGPTLTEFPNQLPKYLHTPMHRGWACGWRRAPPRSCCRTSGPSPAAGAGRGAAGRLGGWAAGRLAAGGWRLAAGGWRLAAGGWRLAAGWLLADRPAGPRQSLGHLHPSILGSAAGGGGGRDRQRAGAAHGASSRRRAAAARAAGHQRRPRSPAGCLQAPAPPGGAPAVARGGRQPRGGRCTAVQQQQQRRRRRRHRDVHPAAAAATGALRRWPRSTTCIPACPVPCLPALRPCDYQLRALTRRAAASPPTRRRASCPSP